MKLNEKETLAAARIAHATLHRKITAGLFPAPVKIDGWHTRWDEGAVLAWREREDALVELAAAKRAVKRLRDDDQGVVALHRRIAELLEQVSGEQP